MVHNMIWGVFAWLFITCLGCGPTAPSVANGPPVVSWSHLQTENWRYELQDPIRITNYRFNRKGVVVFSEGIKKGDVHEVAALAANWYLDDAGDLILTGGNDLKAYRTYRLVALTNVAATVVNVDTGATETYARSNTP